MKRFVGLLILLCLGSLFLWGQIPTVSQENEHIQLGAIKERRLPLEQNLFFCNEGQKKLHIDRLLSTCGCKIVAYSRDSIGYDEMGYISVYLVPPFKAGEFKHEVFAYTNQGTMRYTIEGEFLKSTYQYQNYTAIPSTASSKKAEGRKRRTTK